MRERLERADFAGAARLLGRRYRMIGRVAHGNQLGRALGFPTANLRLMRRKSPMRGVSAVRVYGIAPEPLDGVCEPRHPAHGERRRAAARGACVRFRRRSVRSR